MTKLEKVLYTAKAYATGGRAAGASRSDDGSLQVTLSEPGKPGDGTNPEQLFAASWPACFLSLPGIGQETAQSLVQAASDVCPRSLAASANIDVKYNAITSEAADPVAETQHA